MLAFQSSNKGQISASHDSREVVLRNKGAIHVVKDEAQILPYCILHLTGGQYEKAPGLHRTTEPTTLYELTGPNVARGLAPPINSLSTDAFTASWISHQGSLQQHQQPLNPSAASSSRDLPTPTNSSWAAPTTAAYPLSGSRIWQNSQTTPSGQGWLQHQQLQSNPFAASSSRS